MDAITRETAPVEELPPAAATPARSQILHNLALQVVLLAALLGFCAALIGPGSFTVDERAYHFQAEIAARADGVGEAGWGVAYPTTPFESSELGSPLPNAVRTQDGWYAYARHPLYVEVLSASQQVAGNDGPLLLSLLSVVVAAAALERVARSNFKTPPNLVFWFIGLASPLAFHGFVVWAHAPALALLAVAMAFGLSNSPSRSGIARLGPAVIFGCAALASFLRTEAPIAVVALAIVFLGSIRRHESKVVPAIVNAGAALGGAALGLIVDARWSAAITGEVLTAATEPTSRFDVITNASAILLQSGREPISALRLVGVGLLLIGALWLQRDARLGAIIASFGAACGVIGSTGSSAYVGLVAPAAVLIVGLAIWGQTRRERTQLEAAFVAAAAVVVLGAIVASPWGGGGGGWGGRYALAAVLFATPVAMVSMVNVWKRSKEGQVLVLALVVVTIATQFSGLQTLMNTHDSSEIVSGQLTTALPDLADRVDVMMTSDPRVGPLAPDTAMRVPLISVADDDVIRTVLEEQPGIDRLAVVGVVQQVEFEFESFDRWVVVEQGNDRSLQYLILERTR